MSVTKECSQNFEVNYNQTFTPFVMFITIIVVIDLTKLKCNDVHGGGPQTFQH